MDLTNKTIPIIVGPTASGKSALAIKIAQEFDLEIISADSRQLVKEMDIGTAKVTLAEQRAAKHHFIDIIDPTDEIYNSYNYGIEVRELISQLAQQNRSCLIVGGSGLYIQSAVFGFFDDLQIEADEKLAFREYINQFTAEENFQKLTEIDPQYAQTVPAGNRQRVNRALEVFHFSGKTMTEFLLEHQPKEFFKPLYIGLTPDREKLYNRINQRVEIMVENGLLTEVESLVKKYGVDLKRLNKTIGYQEVIDFFKGDLSQAEMVEKIALNSRHYAKRQLTWFKRLPNIEWFTPEDEDLIIQKIERTLKSQN